MYFLRHQHQRPVYQQSVVTGSSPRPRSDSGQQGSGDSGQKKQEISDLLITLTCLNANHVLNFAFEHLTAEN